MAGTIAEADRAEARIVHISADDRASGTSGNGQYQLAGNLTIGRSDIARIHVVAVTIPRSWYNIPDGNNTITLAVTDTTGPTTTNYVLTIPPANYTAATLCAALQTILVADPIDLASATASYDQPTDTITVASGDDTILLSFIASGNTADVNKVAQALGFYSINLTTFPRYSVLVVTPADTISSGLSPLIDVNAISIHSSLSEAGYCDGANAAVVGVINLAGAQGSVVNWAATGPPVAWDVSYSQLAGFNLTYMRRDTMTVVHFRGQTPTIQFAIYARR